MCPSARVPSQTIQKAAEGYSRYIYVFVTLQKVLLKNQKNDLPSVFPILLLCIQATRDL